uniref:Iron-binding zinc finger CDGSH type domain-containing protein n=1 Tax=Oncorhynchus mykiss TaxID=8022 RepID=A0A8L0DW21_ONCMY
FKKEICFATLNLKLTLQVQRSTLSTEPVIASKKYFKAELVCGKRHSWCTCGHHHVPNQIIQVLNHRLLCGCKYTANPPYCDSTHKQEFIQSALLKGLLNG